MVDSIHRVDGMKIGADTILPTNSHHYHSKTAQLTLC